MATKMMEEESGASDKYDAAENNLNLQIKTKDFSQKYMIENNCPPPQLSLFPLCCKGC